LRRSILRYAKPSVRGPKAFCFQPHTRFKQVLAGEKQIEHARRLNIWMERNLNAWTTTRRYIPYLVSVLALACLSLLPSVTRASSLSDLSDLPGIEKRLTTAYVSRYQAAIRHELKLIARSLESSPVRKRAGVLRDLAGKTRCGSPERAAAYYVCAWYGVNYERCRDYLLNAFFWIERGFYRKYLKQPPPFCWQEDTVSLLYELYERNYDFRLLHDIVTGRSDGCGAEAIDVVRTQALGDHPRGMLHVARMSRSGRSLALEVLTTQYRTQASRESLKRARSIFPAYVRRVAADRKDPLRRTAQSLLREANSLRKG